MGLDTYRIAGLETLCYIKMKKLDAEIKIRFLHPILFIKASFVPAPFFYKKGHHLSSSDTIKVEFFKRFDFTFKILLLSVSFRF